MKNFLLHHGIFMCPLHYYVYAQQAKRAGETAHSGKLRPINAAGVCAHMPIRLSGALDLMQQFFFDLLSEIVLSYNHHPFWRK